MKINPTPVIIYVVQNTFDIFGAACIETAFSKDDADAYVKELTEAIVKWFKPDPDHQGNYIILLQPLR